MLDNSIDREFFIKVYSGDNCNTDISYMVKSLVVKTTKESAQGTITIYDEYAYIAESVLTSSIRENPPSSTDSSSFTNGNFTPTTYGTKLETNPNNPSVPYVSRQCTLYAINTLLKLKGGPASGESYADWVDSGVKNYHVQCFGASGNKFMLQGALYDTIKSNGFAITSSADNRLRSGDIVCRYITKQKCHTAILYQGTDKIWRINENSGGHIDNTRTLEQFLKSYNPLYCAHTLANTNPDGTEKTALTTVEITQPTEDTSANTDSTAQEASAGNVEGQAKARLRFGYVGSLMSPIYDVTITKAQINVLGEGVEITYSFVSVATSEALAEPVIQVPSFTGTLAEIVSNVIALSPHLHEGCIKVDSLIVTRPCNNKNVCTFLQELAANQTSNGESVEVIYDLDGTVHFCSKKDYTEYKKNNVEHAYLVGGYNNNVISFNASINENAPTGTNSPARGYFGSGLDPKTGSYFSFNSACLKNSLMGAQGTGMPIGLPDTLLKMVGSVNNAAVAKLNTATLTIIGDPTIQYLEKIFVDVRLKEGVTHYTSGNWSIIEVSHSLNDSGFTTTLSLQRTDPPETKGAYTSGSTSDPIGSNEAERLKKDAKSFTYKKNVYPINANNECDAAGFLPKALKSILDYESINTPSEKPDSALAYAESVLTSNGYSRFKNAIELTWDNYTMYDLAAGDIIVLSGKTSDSLYIIYSTQGTSGSWEFAEFCEFWDNSPSGPYLTTTPGLREALISEQSKKELNIAIYSRNNG